MMVARTRPRIRDISRTRWEVNITRKYRVASLAMISKRFGILGPDSFDVITRKIVNENARKSE